VAGREHDELSAYPEAFESSWLHTELNKSRNFKTWFKKGLTVATLMNGLEQFVLRGHIPWTLRRDKADHTYLKPAAECEQIVYPKPDGKLTFDRLSSVFISNTNHEENQPAHLTLKDASVPVGINLGVRIRQERGQHRSSADQRAKLRALQNLRHQGPHPKHRLGHARGRRRPQLHGHVSPVHSIQEALRGLFFSVTFSGVAKATAPPRKP
jgi:hypothetical protein